MARVTVPELLISAQEHMREGGHQPQGWFTRTGIAFHDDCALCGCAVSVLPGCAHPGCLCSDARAEGPALRLACTGTAPLAGSPRS